MCNFIVVCQSAHGPKIGFCTFIQNRVYRNPLGTRIWIAMVTCQLGPLGAPWAKREVLAPKWPNSQVLECDCSIYHNASFRTEMCIFMFSIEHCGVWNGCILGFVKFVYSKSGLPESFWPADVQQYGHFPVGPIKGDPWTAPCRFTPNQVYLLYHMLSITLLMQSVVNFIRALDVVAHHIPFTSVIERETLPRLGTHFNMKMWSYQYRYSYYKDKTVSRPYYLYNGNPPYLETPSLYWSGSQLVFIDKITTYHNRDAALCYLCFDFSELYARFILLTEHSLGNQTHGMFNARCFA